MQQHPLYDEALVDALLELAVREDVGEGDITSRATIPERAKAAFVIRTRENCVVAGMPFVERLFATYAPGVAVTRFNTEGDTVSEGGILARIEGSARAILTYERIGLNLLQRLCGIATLTASFKKAVAGLEVDILDTRKTTPGLRTLEKYAVKTGGGSNHRMGLYDAVLIKDNHIAACGGSLREAVIRARAETGSARLQVECDTLEQVREAVSVGVDAILLDNMSVEQLKDVVAMKQGWKLPHPYLEASGGVRFATVRGIAETGVDGISIGALTHSAPNIDIGLDSI